MASEMANLTVQQFKDHLAEDMTRICEENGWKETVAKHRGTAFAIWSSQLIAEQDVRYDTDPIDAHLDGGNDLGVDLVFSNANTGEYLVCQCKFLGKNKRLSEGVVTDFLSLHGRLMIDGYVQTYGHSGLPDALPIEVLKATPDKVTYRLITNATITERTRSTWEKSANTMEGPSFELWTRDEIKRFHAELNSLDDDSPDEIELELPRDQFVETAQPRSSLIAVLTTNALRNLWEQHRHALYAENIRGGIKSNLNQKMRHTLAERPAEFFYFNNGISATCEDFEVIEEGPHRKLHATRFQVINGAQTLNAIGDNDPQSDGRVLFRLTKLGDDSKAEETKAEIIRYNNTQNVVKASDFRSNDRIQRWLEHELSQGPWRWPAMPRRRYARKRQRHMPPGLGRMLKLEDFAKIRYAWLNDPTVVVDATGRLFQDAEAGALYHKAFGVKDELLDYWPHSVLEDAMVAVCFSDFITDRLKDQIAAMKEQGASAKGTVAEDAERYQWMTLYRWHFLSLAGVWTRDRGLEASTLLASEAGLTDAMREFMGYAFDVISQAEQWRKRREEEGSRRLSMRNWRRSAAEWERLAKDFTGAVKNAEVRAKLVGASS